MGYKCCVLSCKSGYKSSNPHKKVSFFGFPKGELLTSWLEAINRKNFTPTRFSRVCSLHFTEGDVIKARKDSNIRRLRGTLKRTLLKENAIPSLFPNNPLYKAKTPTGTSIQRCQPLTSQIVFENIEMTSVLESCEDEDHITSFMCLKEKILNFDLPFGFFLFGDSSTNLTLLKLASDMPPKISKSVVIYQDLSFLAYDENVPLSSNVFQNSMQYSKLIRKFSDFLILLSCVSDSNYQDFSIQKAIQLLYTYAENQNLTCDVNQKLSFLCEQLHFLCQSPGPHQKFSSSLLTHAVIWKAHSTSCYKSILLENVLTLPSLRTLRRVAQKFSHLEKDTLKYLKLRIENLNSFERTVILLFDEIYVHQAIEYENGKFVGLSSNDNMPATTVLCFMIKSLASKYSDVIASIPIHKLSVESLKTNCMTVLKTVMDAGFRVVAFCSDNHIINRSFFNDLSNGNINSPFPNPFDQDQNIFLLIDPVHTIKNLYNCFQKRNVFQFPHSSSFATANFHNIKTLYHLESSMAVRMAHKLTKTVLAPTNIQRTSAKMAFSLFCDSTVAAVKYYSDNNYPEWKDTHSFLSYISNLIKMINIRSKTVGKALKDDLKLPFSSTSDERLEKLLEYADFFHHWRLSRKPGLTYPTFIAIENVCRVLHGLITSLLENYNFKFVLTGFLQSDPIESRFGRYRQMSGGNYFLSVKQVIESERKIRLSSLLEHSGIALNRITHDTHEDHHETTDTSTVFDIDILPDFEMIESELQTVYFVAGYCANRVKTNIICPDCLSLVLSSSSNLPQNDCPSDFFSSLNRGGLKVPADELFILCCNAYQIFCRIKLNSNSFDSFMRLESPRNVFVSTVMHYVQVNQLLPINCKLGHDLNKIFRFSISTFFNCLARNFLRSYNRSSNDSDKTKICKLRSSFL